MEINNNPKISIIIPVYNTSKFLEKCLDSVVNQTFKDFEVICVDDGSSDNSKVILDKYEANYDNFKAIYQPNQGVAITRNTGLEHVRGDFIAFIDSDDFIKENYLEKLYNTAINTNSDIVICNFYRYYEDYNFSRPIIYKKRKGVYNRDQILSSLIPDNSIHSYLWNKLWKKSIFMDDNITFPDIKFEDLAILTKLVYCANKICIIDDALYYYRIRKKSIVRSFTISTQNDYMKACAMIRLFLHENNIYDKFKIPYTLLSIKSSIVMYFVNFFITSNQSKLSDLIPNVKRINHFVSKCNSSDFNYTKEDILAYETLLVNDNKRSNS